MAKDRHEEELHDEIVLENEEVVEEAHDPENAEQQSIDSVKKAADAGIKKVPDLKGQGPMTKAGLISAMYKVFAGMSKADLEGAYKKVMEGVELDDSEFVAEDVDHSAELDAVMSDEATLSEEFKEKTSVIFEAALRAKLSEEVDRLEESYKQELSEEIASTKADMVDKIDSYLNYVVESWMEDNALAIENGIRTEIAESFMGKLKDLFVESYVEVPESKVDLVDDLAAQVEELEEKYNAVVSDSIELAEELKDMHRKAAISEACEGLVDTQAEKLTSLLEGVSFDDAESFAKKAATIKESFFGEKTAKPSEVELAESVETEDEAEDAVEVSAQMSQYLKYLKK